MEHPHRKSNLIGFVRYSQKISFGNQNQNVFEPQYFEYRFKIFKEVTLNSFKAQTDQDFLLIVFHSKSIPQVYRQRFDKLEQQYPFLICQYLDDEVSSLGNALQLSENFVSFMDEAAITFRIDNDDAVPSNYVELIKQYVKKDFIGTAVTLPSVATVLRQSEDEFLIEERYYPLNSIGLAYVTGSGDYNTVLDVAQHHEINKNHPVLVLPESKATMLMTINGNNAVNSINHGKAYLLSKNDFEVFLQNKKLHNINLECLQIFPEKKHPKDGRLKNLFKLLTPPIFHNLRNIFKR